MVEAEPVIRAALPDANMLTSIRSSGVPVGHGSVADLMPTVEGWLADNPDGVACVIATGDRELGRGLDLGLGFGLGEARACEGSRVHLVVLVDAEKFGTGIEGAVDRYVAMTRATQRLVVLTSS